MFTITWCLLNDQKYPHLNKNISGALTLCIAAFLGLENLKKLNSNVSKSIRVITEHKICQRLLQYDQITYITIKIVQYKTNKKKLVLCKNMQPKHCYILCTHVKKSFSRKKW